MQTKEAAVLLHIKAKFAIFAKNCRNMTQIVVTLEEGSDFSIVKNAIKMIKGVKNAMITHSETESIHNRQYTRMRLFDQLAGSISLSHIDTDDERTKYLLSK